jgi:hypothetical protein
LPRVGDCNENLGWCDIGTITGIGISEKQTILLGKFQRLHQHTILIPAMFN